MSKDKKSKKGEVQNDRNDPMKSILKNRYDRLHFLSHISEYYIFFSFIALMYRVNILDLLKLYLRGLFEEGKDNDFYRLLENYQELNMPPFEFVVKSYAVFTQYYRKRGKGNRNEVLDIVRLLAMLKSSLITWTILQKKVIRPKVFYVNKKKEIRFYASPDLGSFADEQAVAVLLVIHPDPEWESIFALFIQFKYFLPDELKQLQVEHLLTAYYNKYYLKTPA